MIRVKKGIVGSTISHMINYWELIMLLVLMMCLVFLVQLLLSERLFVAETLRQEDAKIQNKSYIASLTGAKKEQVDDFISELQPYRGIIDEIIISSQIFIAQGDISNGVIAGDLDRRSESPPYQVISFFPEISFFRDISLSRGEFRFESGNRSLFLSDHAFQVLTVMGNTELDISNASGYTVLINQSKWDCVGVGFLSGLPDGLDATNFIVVDYSNYQHISQTCDKICIFFSSRPSEAEIDKINQIADSRLPISKSFALTLQETDNSAFFSQTGTVAAIVFVLIINVLSLFDYLLSLRRGEFRVYLQTGATLNSIWLLSLLELAIIVVLSVFLAGVIAVLPFARLLFGFQVWKMSPIFFLVNIAGFMGIASFGFIIRMTIGNGRTQFSYASGGA